MSNNFKKTFPNKKGNPVAQVVTPVVEDKEVGTVVVENQGDNDTEGIIAVEADGVETEDATVDVTEDIVDVDDTEDIEVQIEPLVDIGSKVTTTQSLFSEPLPNTGEESEDLGIVVVNEGEKNEVKVPMKKVLAAEDHRCNIGGVWYTLIKGQYTSVPEEVKAILKADGLLATI